MRWLERYDQREREWTTPKIIADAIDQLISIEMHNAAIGLQTELSLNPERFAREIDLGPDATLLPELINMHAHMSFSLGDNVFSDYQAESDEIKTIRAVENLNLALRTSGTPSSPHTLPSQLQDAIDIVLGVIKMQ